MTRDVLIRISGVQMAEEESDNFEVITAGNYFLKNGKHYILYEEQMEGFEGIVKNTIKISPQGMDIKKSGISSVHMAFAPDKKHVASYVTPMGELIVGVNVNQISIDEDEDSLKVKVDYSLDINYEHVSDCEILLNVCSRAKADLNLALNIEGDNQRSGHLFRRRIQ